MNSIIEIGFKNNYHFELIDSTTGKVKQTTDVHNMPIHHFGRLLVGDMRYYGALFYLALGKGTTPPQSTDKALASQLWQVMYTEREYEWIDDYTLRGTASFTFPATSEYVGTVTEAGLTSTWGSYRQGDIVTRALLTDSEGQPISFNKTDLDILVVRVTVEMSFNSLDSSFKIFKKCYLLQHVLGLAPAVSSTEGNNNPNTGYGSLSLVKFDHDLENYNRRVDGYSYNCGIDISINRLDSYTLYTRGYNGNTAYLSINTSRLPSSTVTEQRYYKAVAVEGLGYWELPNEDIFPTYNITNIPIGTGDGTATQFENPLNYFKEGTEKIYKNGVQLVRDVDYTINHRGNKDCLPEVYQDVYKPARIYTEATCTAANALLRPLFLPSVGVFKKARDYNRDVEAPAFNASNPLFIEYEEPVTLNCFKVTGIVRGMYKNTVAALPTNSVLYLDVSEDGEVYEELGSLGIKTTGSPGLDASLNFPTTTAKYWRVRATPANCVPCILGTDPESMFSLTYKDPYITFTEAPADGDILTMDVGMDIMMKNANFVIDVSCRFDFTY